MIPLSLLVLRIGLAISFALTGFLILKDDDNWTHMLPDWFSMRIPSARLFMTVTAWTDLVLSIWIFSGFFTGIAALVAALHLLGVLIVSGKKEFHEVYRDIGLLFAAASLAINYLL